MKKLTEVYSGQFPKYPEGKYKRTPDKGKECL